MKRRTVTVAGAWRVNIVAGVLIVDGEATRAKIPLTWNIVYAIARACWEFLKERRRLLENAEHAMRGQ